MIHLGKLHLIHALACVPVEEGFPPVHGGELVQHSLERLLDRSGVRNKGSRHFYSSKI